MFRVFAVFAFLTFIIFKASVAWAWGAIGHRVTGEIAAKHITNTTRMHVQKLLEGDSLAEVSTWADDMRSSPENFWQKSAGRWHYINLDRLEDFRPQKYAMPFNGPVEDVYGAMLRCITVLRSHSSSEKDKQFHLRFLIHLVADVHQPLHVGRAADRGGNDIGVVFLGEKMSLHYLWDTALIRSEQLSFTELVSLIDTSDQSVIGGYLISSPKEWVGESFELSQSVYLLRARNLGWKYRDQQVPIVKTRLRQAGVRLAGVLNAIFDANAKVGQNAVALP